MASADKVAEEVERLKADIVRLGDDNGKGQYQVLYGKLFDDPEVEQFYEALLGTLKAARKQNAIAWEGQMLLKGQHDNVVITLLIPPEGAAPPAPTEAMAATSIEDAAPPAVPIEEAAPDAAEEPGAAAEEDEDGAAGGEGAADENFKVRPKVRRASSLVSGFEAISQMAVEEQCEFFLKSFIFDLGDKWTDVPALLKRFQKHAKDAGTDGTYMDQVQVSGFMQKEMPDDNLRTANQRNAEIADVDANYDGKIQFIEYLTLHFKAMILIAYAKRHEMEPLAEWNLDRGAIGVVNVGHQLREELLTLPQGMDPALEAAIEEFTEEQKRLAAKKAALAKKAEAGGVKGKAAAQELVILESGDTTEINRRELTLNAARRRAAKMHGAEVLARAQKNQCKRFQVDIMGDDRTICKNCGVRKEDHP